MSQRLRQVALLLSSPADMWLLARICAWILIQPLLLRTRGLGQVMEILTPKPNTVTPHPRAAENIVRYADFFFRKMTLADETNTESMPFQMQRSCLKRSMVLYRLLRQAGIPVSFNLGVRKENDVLKGHAWLELDGKFYFPNEETGYKTVFKYPQDHDEG